MRENKAIDRTVSSLCHEIDDLRESCLYWKEKYEQEVAERNAELNERLESAQKGIGNILMFALNTREMEDGSLSISPEARQEIVENWKS